MFILISGLVLSLRYDGDYSIKTFYKKRINRILVPYLIWSVIYVTMTFILTKDISVQRIIYMLFTGSAYYHLWFFFLIFQLYLIFPFYRKLLKGRSFIMIIFTYGLQILFNHYKIGVVGNEQLAMIINRIFLSHIFYFSLGIWIADNIGNVEIQLSKLNYYLNLMLVIIITWASYIFTFNWLATNNDFFPIFNALVVLEKALLPLVYVLVFIVLYSLAKKITNAEARKYLELISRYSFGIYLSHALILYTLIKLIKQVNIVPNNFSFYFITFAGTLIASIFFCIVLERTVFSKYLLSIDQKKKVE